MDTPIYPNVGCIQDFDLLEHAANSLHGDCIEVPNLGLWFPIYFHVGYISVQNYLAPYPIYSHADYIEVTNPGQNIPTVQNEGCTEVLSLG